MIVLFSINYLENVKENLNFKTIKSDMKENSIEFFRCRFIIFFSMKPIDKKNDRFSYKCSTLFRFFTESKIPYSDQKENSCTSYIKDTKVNFN